jgi:hypothetical protein
MAKQKIIEENTGSPRPRGRPRKQPKAESLPPDTLDLEHPDGTLVYLLPQLLQKYKISIYQLGKESGVAFSSLYAIKNLPGRFQVSALVRIIAALRRLTGQDIRVHDVLEYFTLDEWRKHDDDMDAVLPHPEVEKTYRTGKPVRKKNTL